MPVGSHKDAFKAHQLVKKLVRKDSESPLARLAAEILLNFVRHHRQVIPDLVLETLPEDGTAYDSSKLDNALESVESLCSKCAEHHVNGCFVNQARRALIAAKIGADPGSDFDGTKGLEQLIEDAESLDSRPVEADSGSNFDDTKRLEQLLEDATAIGSRPSSSEEPPGQYCLSQILNIGSRPSSSEAEEPDASSLRNAGQEDTPETYAALKRKYEDLKEKDIFRATLIEEIVETIRSVSEGNLEAEMPVHDDPQLGQLATAFNLMLGTINTAMSHLDSLVATRTSALNRSNQALQDSIRQINETNLRLNTTLREVETANLHITESIQYAKLIQRSMLPNPDNIRPFLLESFYICMPRDIVGGDFIFTDYVGGGFVLAVIDCTGHGVPGAFMTLIAAFGLRKIIRDEGRSDPAQILKRLSFIVKTMLHQDTDYALSDDGLDAAVCFIRGPETEASDVQGSLTFAGARLPLFCVHDDEVTVIKGDRESVGYKKSSLNFNFTNHVIPVREGMAFYMASDGFADQLGGERDRRFGLRRLRELLRKNHGESFERQRELLLQAFNAYKRDNERQDDVTLLGFRF